MTIVVDTDLTEFEIRVYTWIANSIRETGEPMRQATIANKMRCSRPSVRNALIILDRRGHLAFTRFRPQATTLTDIDRVLVNDPDAAPPASRPAPMPRQDPPTMARMPWDV